MYADTGLTPRTIPPIAHRMGSAHLTFDPGATIFSEGEDARHLYRLRSGVVRTLRHSLEGRRQVIAFYYPGALFGLEISEAREYAAEALSEVEIEVVRFGGFIDDDASDPLLHRAAMEELERTRSHLAMLGRRTAQEKIASFLVDLSDQDRSLTLTLPMSRQDMADYLGLAIETVSRVLGQFQSTGILMLRGCRDLTILREGALARMAAT